MIASSIGSRISEGARRTRRWSSWSTTFCAATLSISNLLAADIPVTTVNDSGAGSLRQGLSVATSGDRLVFNSLLNGSTLTGGSALSVSQPVTLYDPNTITLTDSHAYVLAKPMSVDWAGSFSLGGVLSDGVTSGSLIKTGTGTLVLGGSNTYTGGTIFNGGTLRLLNDHALGTGTLSVHNLVGSTFLEMADGVKLGNNIDLQSELVVKQNAGTTVRIDGIISETGGPQDIGTSGTGTLILSGANTFSGGIYVSNDSTIRAENSSALGTGQVTVAGALTLDLANGINVGNHLHLGNNFTANVNTGSATLSGLIDEIATSRLTKTGDGTLILSGNSNSYTGTTTVNAGDLQVQGSIVSDVLIANISSTLSGAGQVGNVTNDGFIRPGNSGVGNLTVNGNFTQNAGGTTEIEINSAGNTPGVNNDHLTVTGQANLGGTLNVVAVGGGVFQSGTNFTILNSTGVVNGQYTQVTDNLSMFGLVLSYNANDVVMQLVQTSTFAGTGRTTNEVSVGTALDNITLTSSGDLFTMINTLGAQSSDQQQRSMDQLSGSIYGSTQTIGLQVGDQFLQRIITRLVSNGTFLASVPAGVTTADSGVRGQLANDSINGWIQGYGVGGSLRTDGNGAGVRYSQGGGLYGVDLGQDETGVIGIVGGNSYVGYHDGYDSKGQLTAYQVGLYALKHNDLAYVLGTANYGYNDYVSNRTVNVGGIDQFLRGTFGGNQFGAYAETGLKLHAGWFHLQPLLGLQYLYLSQQGFSESGGPAALNVAGAQANSLRTSLGGRLVVDRLTGPWGSVWTPYWHTRWVSEVLDDDRIITASFNGAPIGGAFTSHGTKLGQNYGVFGKGVAVQLSDQWAMYGNFDVMFGGRLYTETGSLGAVYSF
ncbi:autotransporter outer membrane beta-barrel domain-containing protein [Schlesneria paludicola]|uniref:autotransporter outer membrane beta-barrel domain-containing protein n=1 Tax=Schlesneria paludicola TaxID=360056 RepID=UPI000315F0D5|nr:autotransporter domain-containing protein [Schlesneria paludicola]